MSEQPNKRSQRVSELIKHELATIITHEVKDPRVGFVTVTEVRATSDLKHAKVFVSLYGDDAQRQASLQGLNKAVGYLKREISRRLELRHTPELVFAQDETLDKADRMQQLMLAIQRGDAEAPEPTQQAVVPAHTIRTGLKELHEQHAERGRQKSRGKKRPKRR